MEFLQSTLRALPAAATNPLAFIGYAITVTAWLILSIRVARNKELLANLEKLPEADRLPALRAEMGMIDPPSGMSVKGWLKARTHTYFLFGFGMALFAAVTVFAIALFRREPKADEPNEIAYNFHITQELWDKKYYAKQLLLSSFGLVQNFCFGDTMSIKNETPKTIRLDMRKLDSSDDGIIYIGTLNPHKALFVRLNYDFNEAYVVGHVKTQRALIVFDLLYCQQGRPYRSAKSMQPTR